MDPENHYKPPATDSPLPRPPTKRERLLRILGRVSQIAGAVLLVIAGMGLLFSCSPANTADAPALLSAAIRAGVPGLVALVVGALLARSAGRPSGLGE